MTILKVKKKTYWKVNGFVKKRKDKIIVTAFLQVVTGIKDGIQNVYKSNVRNLTFHPAIVFFFLVKKS